MKFVAIFLFISKTLCYAEGPKNSEASLFEHAISYEKSVNHNGDNVDWKKFSEAIFGKSRCSIISLEIELNVFMAFISNSQAWRLTSVANGLTMMGQAPEGWDRNKLCLDIGISYANGSGEEDIKIVIITNEEFGKYSHLRGEEVIKRLAGDSKTKISGYMLIEKGNGWFSDNQKTDPAPKFDTTNK